MIRAKIEEYRMTNNENILAEITSVASGNSSDAVKAMAFLYAEGNEEYRKLVLAKGEEISALPVDESGLFMKEGTKQEELLAESLPVYALYKTKTDKNYNELVTQCRQAVKKYPASEEIFAMLAEVLEYMSEQIFEHYRAVRTLLWEQYAVMEDKASDKVCYALAKGCFYKAFLYEKYASKLENAVKDEAGYPLAYFAVLRLNKRFERV